MTKRAPGARGSNKEAAVAAGIKALPLQKSFGIKIPVDLVVILGAIAVAIELHWAFWYYLDVDIDAQKLLIETATGGVVAAIYGLMSAPTKAYINAALAVVLSSRAVALLLVSVALVSLICGISIARIRVVWSAGQPDIFVDGQDISTKDWIGLSSRSTSLYGLSFTTKKIEVGDYSQTIHFRPLVSMIYDIPESVIFSSEPKYREIVSLLTLSFYQFVENKFLTDAKNAFDADDTKRFVDLNTVYQILKLCFVESDVARNGDVLLARFEEERASSPWIPLLRACQSYSRADYDVAAAQLETIPENAKSPLLETYIFFRGVNNLRSFVYRISHNGVRDADLMTKVQETFKKATDVTRSGQKGYFQEMALPSAEIFLGISYVYDHDNDKASAAFEGASASTYPDLRARAFSDLGYVTLLRGDLKLAETFFVRALEASPSFPYAETNLGYAYMAEGRYAEARKLFFRLTQDDALKHDSMRDVILSEIAVAHIDTETNVQTAPNPDAYNAPLKEMGIFNYEGTQPAVLRQALVHIAIADRIYMSPDYYGLEILASAMYARAYFEAGSLTGNEDAVAAMAKSRSAFEKVRKTIDPRCFIFSSKTGFFKPVADLVLVDAASSSSASAIPSP